MVTQSAAIHIEDLAPVLVSPDVSDRFYKYKGSLTTPGCYESVTWFVMNSHPQITEKEVSSLRDPSRHTFVLFTKTKEISLELLKTILFLEHK